MRLFHEILLSGGLEASENAPFPRCVLLPDRGGYFEGVRSVGDFSEELLVLYFSRAGGVVIKGERLAIEKYCDGDLRVSGRIASVQFGDPAKLCDAAKRNADQKGENAEPRGESPKAKTGKRGEKA